MGRGVRVEPEIDSPGSLPLLSIEIHSVLDPAQYYLPTYFSS
jgi:hypothetical protein